MEQKTVNDFFNGKLRGFLINDMSICFSNDYHTFNEEIQNAIYATGNRKLFPFMEYITIVYHRRSGGELRASKVGGSTVFTGHNPVIEYISIYDDTGIVFKRLAKFKNMQIRIFLIDNENYVYGTKDKQGKFKGFLSSIIALNRDNQNTYLTIEYSNIFQNEDVNSFGIKLENEIDDLTEIELQRLDKGCAKVVSTTYKTDLTEIYQDELVNVKFYLNSLGKNPISVAFDKKTDSLIFFPADKYKIADASILKSHGIEGLDSSGSYIDLS
jgi:hypothetical protein